MAEFCLGRRCIGLLACIVIAGCGDRSAEQEASANGDGGPPVENTASQSAPDAEIAAKAGAGGATPNADRIATLGLLNKRNNLTQDLVLKVGETRKEGKVIVRLQSCERTPPWERPEETGAFVQLFVEERPDQQADAEWQTVFSGWLFKNSPALNVVEHPVYDLWVKDCAMSFPGEEAKSAASESSSSASNASGNDSESASGE